MARWQSQGNNEPPASGLQPRYRRLFSVGALLDETIQLFRHHWLRLALFGTVALIPSWLILLVVYLGGFQSTFAADAAQSSSIQDFPIGALIGVIGLALLSGLFTILWTCASTAAADAFMRSQDPTLMDVYGHALRRFPALLGSMVLYLLAGLGLWIASAVLFVVTAFGTLGSLAAIIGLLVWWLNPNARRTWLKWLIILTAPFGLLMYYSVRWAVLIPAIVIEHKGPLGALKRSAELTDHQWFRTLGVMVLAGIIVVVLVTVPIAIVDVVVTLVTLSSSNGEVVLQVVNSTASSICQVLFSSIGTIAYVILFVDLRNRREGADLGERIESLETSPV